MNLVQEEHRLISDVIEVEYGELAVQSTKSAISLKWGKIEQSYC